jgi:hypothetical protein
MITAYTGETINIKLTITDVSNLDDAMCKFAVANNKGEIVLEQTPIIEGNTLTAKLQSTDTLIPGNYRCEFRIRIAEEVVSVFYDRILLTKAVLTEVE